MSKFSDSRDANGIGFLILQDHGYLSKGVPDHGRGSLVGVRVIGRDDNEGQDGKWREDELARGPIGGGVYWPRTKENAGAWQFGWASIVADEGIDPQRHLGDKGLIPRPIGGVSHSKLKAAGLIAPGQRKPSDPPATSDQLPGGGGGGGQEPDPKKDPVAAFIQKAQKQPGGWLAKATDLVAPIIVGPVGALNLFQGAFGINVNPLPLVGVNPAFKIGGAFGIGVAPWNINIVGASAHRDIVVKKAKGDEEQNAAWYHFDNATVARVPLKVFPSSRTWFPDGRYKGIEPATPIGWPDFPRGYATYTVHSSNEESQDELALSVDPRMIAVNAGSPFTMGTIVTDTTGDGAIDLSRGARLHSMMRVVQQPQAFRGGLRNNQQNWISWNIGPSGQWDSRGGLVTDVPQSGGGTMSRAQRIHALASVTYGGPFDVGEANDIHQWGTDGDGIPINSLHLSTDAPFKVRGSSLYDGAIFFEYAWPDPPDLTYPVHVHWGFDTVSQMWKLFTTTQFTTEKNPTPPPENTPPPVITPPTGGGGGHPGPPDPRHVDPDPDPRRIREVNVTHMETRFPAISFRPQRMLTGTPDLRYTIAADPENLSRAVIEDPTVARLEAWGTQTGKAGGPYLTGAGEWSYTHRPGQAPYLGGTASGGLLLTSPEYGMEAIDNNLVRAGFAASTTYLATAPGNYFGAGLPELSSGGMKTAYSWGADTSGDLNFRSHDSAGVATTRFTMDAAGLHDFNDHASILVADGAATQTINIAPAIIDGWTTDGTSSQMTPDQANNKITVVRTGTYLINFQASFEGSANTVAELHLRIDAVEQDEGTHRHTSGTDTGSCSFVAVKQLTAAEEISVYVEASADSKNFTPLDMQLTAVRVR